MITNYIPQVTKEVSHVVHKSHAFLADSFLNLNCICRTCPHDMWHKWLRTSNGSWMVELTNTLHLPMHSCNGFEEREMLTVRSTHPFLACLCPLGAQEQPPWCCVLTLPQGGATDQPYCDIQVWSSKRLCITFSKPENTLEWGYAFQWILPHLKTTTEEYKASNMSSNRHQYGVEDKVGMSAH